MPELKNVHYYVATSAEKHAVYHEELRLPTIEYLCAGCGNLSHARIIAAGTLDYDNGKSGFVWWCSCACGQPAVMWQSFSGPKKMTELLPKAMEFHASKSWPADLAKLFTEGAQSFSAEAYTACAMVCRKVLSVCAVLEGAKDDESFQSYVSYITDKVLTFEKARLSIDKIRKIGNEANHDVAFVSEDDARRAMKIVNYLLDTIYSLPNA